MIYCIGQFFFKFKFRWGVPYGTQGLAPARKNMILVPVSFSY